MKRFVLACVLAFGFAVSAFGFIMYGDFAYSERNGEITIWGYSIYATRDVVIPERINGLPVVAIGSGAFLNNQLTSVTIPNSVISIGGLAFANNQLTSVFIPNSVSHIAEDAFDDNVNKFRFEASRGQITITGYTGTMMVIPERINGLPVVAIGDGAFFYNQLTSVSIPDSVTHIGMIAFAYNQLTSVSIPNSVIDIGGGAFDDNVTITRR